MMDAMRFKAMREKVIRHFIEEVCQGCENFGQPCCDIANVQVRENCSCPQLDKIRTSLDRLEESIEILTSQVSEAS